MTRRADSPFTRNLTVSSGLVTSTATGLFGHPAVAHWRSGSVRGGEDLIGGAQAGAQSALHQAGPGSGGVLAGDVHPAQGSGYELIVTVGQLDGGLRVIQDGLTASDRVIVNGLMRARPGQEVTPQQTDTPPAKGGNEAKAG